VHCHPWIEALDIKKINLGEGVRSIAEGGVFNSKYQLSVPKLKEQ